MKPLTNSQLSCTGHETSREPVLFLSNILFGSPNKYCIVQRIEKVSVKKRGLGGGVVDGVGNAGRVKRLCLEMPFLELVVGVWVFPIPMLSHEADL